MENAQNEDNRVHGEVSILEHTMHPCSQVKALFGGQAAVTAMVWPTRHIAWPILYYLVLASSYLASML